MRVFRKPSVAVAAVALAVLVLAAAAWALTRRPTPPGPAVPTEREEPAVVLTEGDLHFPPGEIDFGLIHEATSRNVELENRGPHVLRILDVKTSCACTASQPDRTTLGPGERGRITITITPRSDESVQRTAVVLVTYRDTQDNTLHQGEIHVHVRFRPDLEVPSQVVVRGVEGDEGSGELRLSDNRGEHALNLTEVKTSAPDLHAHVESEKDTIGQRFLLMLSCDSGRRPGSYAETITLRTTDSERPTLVVKANVEVAPRIQVAPEVLRLKPDPADPARCVGRVTVTDAGGQPVEFASITPSDGRLHCAADGRPSPRRVLTVSLSRADAAALPGPLRIRLVLKQPVAKEIAVRVAADAPAPHAPGR